MDPYHAALLGILQGVTEILPISSSAHLIIIPWLFRWPESGITFDVALHLGTFLALCLYFRKDIVDLTRSFFSVIRSRRLQTAEDFLAFYIILGTFPAALAGKTLESHIEEIFRRSPLLIAVFLILFALLLAFSDSTGAKQRKLGEINLSSAMLIGLAQCLALIPGVSRSGVTITAALLLGYERHAAARFSFLLSLPIVAGAALLKVGGLIKTGIPAGETAPLLIGVATSAIFGYLSVAFLLRLIQRHSLYPFVWYRLAAGSAILAWLLL